MSRAEAVGEPRAVSIRALNDAFRTSFVGGRVVLTVGVQAQSPDTIAAVLAKVRSFSAFDDDNDPHAEHDFGEVEVAGARFLWKLDYFDVLLRLHSPDKAEPVLTARVLTIMTAREY